MGSERNQNQEITHLKSHILALESERDRLKARNGNFQILLDRLADQLQTETPNLNKVECDFDGISFVIAYYDIPDQIERTLLSCSPEYQRANTDEIEVILIDNGSKRPLCDNIKEKFPHISKIIRVDGHASPVYGLNKGIEQARFKTVAVMIDGAHMLSPGIFANVRDVSRLFHNPVINVPQYILGTVSQNLAQASNAFERESNDLKALGWPKDGYRLFDYAVFPGENFERNYLSAIESNCLIARKQTFERCGAYDMRFDEPGAGFANLELFSRLIHDPDCSYVLLPGEGSFHQDHSGTTTQKAPEERDDLVHQYKQRYLEITGYDGVLNTRSPFLYGVSRHSTQHVPTISKAFGSAKSRILRQLANIYVARARGALEDDTIPQLAVGGSPDERLARTPLKPLNIIDQAAQRNGVPPKNLSYTHCLKAIHDQLTPKLYFEIGVDTGASLRLSKCESIGVDPGYFISNPIAASCRLFRETSDDFFAQCERCRSLLRSGVNLAFIDGMHLAEYVLKDFINTEKYMAPGGVIMFDDVLPEQMEMLERERRYNAWCGDVYKIIPILQRYRPDLDVKVIEAFVGPYRKGLAIVSNLNPNNTVLEENYAKIEADILNKEYDVSSIVELEKIAKISKLNDIQLTPAAPSKKTRTNLAARRANARPKPSPHNRANQKKPRLSMIVINFNMVRELPRTLLSLSPAMQKDIDASEYEIIIVDNGSSQAIDLTQCAPKNCNLHLITMPPGNPSPCIAINEGLAAAQGELAGVMIDGARIASPGLLRQAIDALNFSKQTIVGTLGFHIGDEVQSEAIKNGYNQNLEDKLLKDIKWEKDGYRLFDISVLAKSSGKGWFSLPSESNALIMHREFWDRLNGYEERFTMPGGGLANLDIWKRACETPGADVVMLLGEGTFHQIHGGASTNAPVSPRVLFDREYQEIRGKAYERPQTTPRFFGQPNPYMLRRITPA